MINKGSEIKHVAKQPTMMNMRLNILYTRVYNMFLISQLIWRLSAAYKFKTRNLKAAISTASFQLH